MNQLPILIVGSCVIESEEIKNLIAETLCENSESGKF